MSELVTGEAVALELRPARLPSRALAVLLDLAAAVAAYVAVTIAQRDAWVRCMNAALDERQPPAELRELLRQRFAEVANFLRNVPE